MGRPSRVILRSTQLTDDNNFCPSVYLALALSRHKAILDYLSASGFNESFQALRKESRNQDFTPGPQQKSTGLLEKKWTSVIRLQKKVR